MNNGVYSRFQLFASVVRSSYRIQMSAEALDQPSIYPASQIQTNLPHEHEQQFPHIHKQTFIRQTRHPYKSIRLQHCRHLIHVQTSERRLCFFINKNSNTVFTHTILFSQIQTKRFRLTRFTMYQINIFRISS